MKHLSILIPNGQNNLSSIVGPYKIFTRANDYFESKGNSRQFQIELIGTEEKVDFYEGLFTVNPHKKLHQISKTNLIIIPSLNHNYKEAISGNQEMISWLSYQFKSGTEIASICTGAFLLASTGVLDEKSCSTHWSAAANFKEMFPKVNLKEDQLITDENGIYTNGGAYSFLNLMIYLIEKFYDKETAIHCAKVFQIDFERNSQSEFSIFQGYKKHGDVDILNAQAFLEKNYADKISMESLSINLNLGRRNFDRRFKKATSLTPIDYLQRVKIEAAKKSFELSRKNISEVMYEVGYNDSKAFREVFCKLTGLTPQQYQGRYYKSI
ncbi:helix-turn-helix domain-containing protein [uncultured Algoriphagus sp.]|uniref:GlxA family transcriptional regulator n=1 Tax=uncultured Algoriphagus sp. TaxID=417365 RepID=UPI0030EF2561|tara:strand:+ start:20709 stop:21683 length:975 start_codon:yes stop_codon:yes gene_type:complete